MEGDRIFLRAGTYYPTKTLMLLEHGGRKAGHPGGVACEHVSLTAVRVATVNG